MSNHHQNALARWGVIQVAGPDAVQFLHAQLSNDVAGLGEHTLRMAGLCTAKGRLLGTFFIMRKADTILLVTRKDTVAALVKRLSMFVLRSKCKVSDASASWSIHALDHIEAFKPMQVLWPEDVSQPIRASLRAITPANPAQQPRMPGFELVPVVENVLAAGGDDAFELDLFELGIPYVSAATVEMFVPQSMNFDLVGGVSFSKGCYPGQEVVARSHYLGKLKRRAVRVVSAGTTTQVSTLDWAGKDVWLIGKDNEPAGQVITAVQQGHQWAMLVELPLDMLETPDARFEARTDTETLPLQVLGAPYDLHQKGNLFEVA
ncbi:MAG TPA: folate-binding protein [Limnobacter sp.]|uniref:CAF17-like 4Fe-4S cluster assembly/insertion protein YgfZ n=1 Tax=Limnobacter sp. TaxID=2003368 RepID=UPI002ED9B455